MKIKKFKKDLLSLAISKAWQMAGVTAKQIIKYKILTFNLKNNTHDAYVFANLVRIYNMQAEEDGGAAN